MRSLLVVSIICLFLPSLLLAETYVVRPDGMGDLPTIQAAVDAAANGDVIELTDGTFIGPGNRNVFIEGKILTIRSQSGDPHSSIIDCEAATRGFIYVSGGGNPVGGSLEGITIRNGSSPDFGGGVFFADVANVTVRSCIFSGNTSTGNGGAVMVDGCSFAMMIECTFIGNSSGAGGALCT
jgi:predicted outer membrane repeat protein